MRKRRRNKLSSGESLILQTGIDAVQDPETRAILRRQVECQPFVVRSSESAEFGFAGWRILGLRFPRVPNLPGPSERIFARVKCQLAGGANSTAELLIVNGHLAYFVNPGRKLLQVEADEISSFSVDLFPPYKLPNRQKELYSALDRATVRYEKRGIEFEERVETMESGEATIYGEVGMIVFGRTTESHLWIGSHFETHEEKRFRSLEKFVAWLTHYQEPEPHAS